MNPVPVMVDDVESALVISAVVAEQIDDLRVHVAPIAPPNSKRCGTDVEVGPPSSREKRI
jgi:hypothetical protein